MSSKRSSQVSVTLLASLALVVGPALAGCRGQETRNSDALHCVDRDRVVVDESLCRDGSRQGSGALNPGYLWYYGGLAGLGRGAVATGGSFEPNAGASYQSAGGTKRGGFGTSVNSGGSADGSSGQSIGG